MGKIQISDNGGLILDCGCIFKIESTGFADGLDAGVRERRIDNDPKVFGLNIRKDETAIN